MNCVGGVLERECVGVQKIYNNRSFQPLRVDGQSAERVVTQQSAESGCLGIISDGAR